eukprot:TRINITY_DN5374_c0_g1::TRINITY_DN5374_c0_g1_i1::g.24227::m.24227 TRINITY_DN5374_c0_g1::TRINITY_DN5374_c0_g1_i1::g.24227  ORF type:complete len:102 (+),score=7.63 TRINITY_DN5374_c0_g1_i1:251-556(+)
MADCFVVCSIGTLVALSIGKLRGVGARVNAPLFHLRNLLARPGNGTNKPTGRQVQQTKPSWPSYHQSTRPQYQTNQTGLLVPTLTALLASSASLIFAGSIS